MVKKRNEFGEPEHRFGGEMRQGCLIEPELPAGVCKEMMKGLKEYVDGRFLANAEALIHRTKETDAHFLVLNGNQARLDKDRDEYLRYDLYDSEHKSLINRIDKLSQRIADIQLWRAAIGGKADKTNVIATLAMITTGIIGLISIILAVAHYFKG